MVDFGASMHMLSKKDLSSDELKTMRRSRHPTVAVTANGEVQTNEEAQENVHDIGLFVTVQLLEVTLAVPSLGKLYEEHGYSNVWASGQRPLLTTQGNTITCRTDNFVPSVILELASSSVTASSQHRQYKTCLHQVQSQCEVTNRLQETGARLMK